MARRNIMDEIMAEPVEMPGFPQLIVTRGFACQWLGDCGWSPAETGFGSLDYIVFSKRPIESPLMSVEMRDRYLAQVREDYLR